MKLLTFDLFKKNIEELSLDIKKVNSNFKNIIKFINISNLNQKIKNKLIEETITTININKPNELFGENNILNQMDNLALGYYYKNNFDYQNSYKHFQAANEYILSVESYILMCLNKLIYNKDEFRPNEIYNVLKNLKNNYSNFEGFNIIFYRYIYCLVENNNINSNYIVNTINQILNTWNNGKLITSSSDETIKVIKLKGEDKYEIEQILKGHKNWVMKVIEIRENELISISTDKSMKIWILNKEKKFECITTIKFKYKYSFSNILKINEKEFVTSSLSDGLKFWNSNNYSIIAFINNIEMYWTLKTMCLLNDNILCVGGDNLKGFYLIQISNHQIIKNILGPERIFCIDKCLDGLFLCSIFDENGNDCIVKYKFENYNLEKIVEKVNAHDTWIWSCVELNNGIIASGGRDNLIKLWSN